MVPIDESVAHLQLVVGSGIVLVEPGCVQPVPMPVGAAEQMCAELDARGDHGEAARHRKELQVLEAVARCIATSRAQHGSVIEADDRALDRRRGLLPVLPEPTAGRTGPVWAWRGRRS